jgi:3-deoxy-D-manno-octulosonic-acid transferase
VTRHLQAVGLQEKSHAALWAHLGVSPQRLHLTGSVKYDPAGDHPHGRDFRPVLAGFGFEPADPILLGGSTHEGEEEILADGLRILRAQFPAARLLIAPRHVERTAKIAASLTPTGFRIARRTDPHTGPAPDILLLDTTGELRDWYACADAVFMGKSLCGSGGQNPVEAILAGRPVLFGPRMENFAALRDALLAAGGAVEVRDANHLAAETIRLFTDPSHRAKLVENAGTALRPHHGATVRTAELVENAVMGSDSPRARV